jgi:hypothetical protein
MLSPFCVFLEEQESRSFVRLVAPILCHRGYWSLILDNYLGHLSLLMRRKREAGS